LALTTITHSVFIAKKNIYVLPDCFWYTYVEITCMTASFYLEGGGGWGAI